MPNPVTHLAIADKIYSLLGEDIISNLPLFFSGNLAPDAIHARTNYQRSDKIRSHLRDDVTMPLGYIRSFGYGDPDAAKLSDERIKDFIEKYYLSANEDKDLYLGYAIHILADQFVLFMIYEQLENHLISIGIDVKEPDYRKNLIDKIHNGEYKYIFDEITKSFDLSISDYVFEHDIVALLESVWDYEVPDHITANEANISKRWVIDRYFKNAPSVAEKRDVGFVDIVAQKIIAWNKGK